MRCWVYIDGFNLYHGIIKRSAPEGLRWLDVYALSQRLRPSDAIERIKYFTALVEKRSNDPDQQRRQRLYWRALDTLPCLQRIEGRFTRWEKHLPLTSSVKCLESQQKRGINVVGIRPRKVSVIRSEEKSSDVNLAAHLVHDAHQTDPAKGFEVALVLSTDSDLAEAIRLVTQAVGKAIYICKPEVRNQTSELAAVATGVFNLKTKHLRASLFPDTLTDGDGSFSKPQDW